MIILKRTRTASVYDERFFRWHESGSFRSAEQVVPLLLDLVNIKSVCDVGCGIGTWLAAFRNEGVADVIGLDGDYVDKNMLRIPTSMFKPTDLRHSFSINRRFDAAISFEVAEHLPSERARGFVRDLTALSSIIIFSAAVPRQGGTDHINEQWPGYWINLFNEQNYVLVDAIRAKIWENEQIEPFYRQNMFIFCADLVLDQYPKLTETQLRTMPLRVIHPDQYTTQIDGLVYQRDNPGPTSILRSLPRSIYNAVTRRIKPSWVRIRS